MMKPPVEAKLIIEEETTDYRLPTTDYKLPTTSKQPTSLASLERIRQKVSDHHRNNGNEVKPVTEEELYVAWGAFIEKLAIKKNHSAVTNFKMALLGVVNNNSIEIIADSNIQQKFIEQERAALVDHLQEHFCNK